MTYADLMTCNMAAVHRLDNSKFRVYECEALPGVAYPGVRDNRSTVNTKTGYDDMMMTLRKQLKET